MNSIIISYDETKQASIFGNNEFEIYKNTTKTHTIKKIYSIIGGLAKNILKIYKILNNIKTRFFELNKLATGFTPKQKD